MRLSCDLNVLKLPELRIDSESLFQTVGAEEEKRCAAVWYEILTSVNKFISADLSPRRARVAPM